MSLIVCPRCAGNSTVEVIETHNDSTVPTLPRRVACSFCGGLGLVNIEEATIRCPHCGQEIGVVATGR